MKRFWDKVEKTATCWLWKAAHWQGYGLFSFAGRKQRAHRIAWEYFFGTIPQGQCVLHRCDTPACVNPDHLFLGTMHDNMYDAMSKGRLLGARGAKNSHAKLTEIDVQEIRKRPMPSLALAKAFMINRSAIHKILRRESWKHI